jgi:O-antigen/teichoic acid export membrane protein
VRKYKALLSFFNAEKRKGRFLRTLTSSYVHLASSTFFTLALVPIILRYKGASFLGVWTLSTQLSSFGVLIDAGITASCIRSFITLMANNRGDELAKQFRCAFLVSVFQGALICSLVFLGPFIAYLLHVPEEFNNLFCSLFSAQCLVLGLGFPIRPFSALLISKQQFGVAYLFGSFANMLSLGLAFISFYHHYELLGLISGLVLVKLTEISVIFCSCRRHYFIPAGWTKSAVAFSDFRSLLHGSLFFFVSPFCSSASGLCQATFLSRVFGVESIAIWSVGSKIANLLVLLFSKVFESAFSGMAEIKESINLKDMARVYLRLFFISMSFVFIIAFFLLFCNGPFIKLWTSDKLMWPAAGTLFISIWLIISVFSRSLFTFVSLVPFPNLQITGPLVELMSFCIALALFSLYPVLYLYPLVLSIPLIVTSLHFYLPRLTADAIPMCKDNLRLLRILYASACFYIIGILFFITTYYLW